MEQIVEAGLPKRFARFNKQPTYINEKRWIGNVYDYYAK